MLFEIILLRSFNRFVFERTVPGDLDCSFLQVNMMIVWKRVRSVEIGECVEL